jgi:hypothetical protein
MANKETYNQAVNPHTIQGEVEADPGVTTAIDHIDTVAGGSPVCDIHFTTAISGGEKTALDAVMAAHSVGSGQPPPNALATGYVENARLVYNSASSVDITAGKARDSSDAQDIIWGSTLTASLAASGANGLDTGSEAASTWYAVHVIGGGENPEASLLSLSATAPTLPGTYTVFRHIGWIRNHSTSDIVKFFEAGAGHSRKTVFDHDTRNDLRVLNNGTSTTISVVDLSSFVPPGVEDAILTGRASSTVANSYWVIAHGDSTRTRQEQIWRAQMGPATAGDDESKQIQVQTNASREIKYAVKDATTELDLFVIGYRMEL